MSESTVYFMQQNRPCPLDMYGGRLGTGLTKLTKTKGKLDYSSGVVGHPLCDECCMDIFLATLRVKLHRTSLEKTGTGIQKWNHLALGHFRLHLLRQRWPQLVD